MKPIRRCLVFGFAALTALLGPMRAWAQVYIEGAVPGEFAGAYGPEPLAQTPLALSADLTSLPQGALVPPLAGSPPLTRIVQFSPASFPSTWGKVGMGVRGRRISLVPQPQFRLRAFFDGGRSRAAYAVELSGLRAAASDTPSRPLFAPGTDSIIHVSNMGRALQTLRAGSWKMSPELRRVLKLLQWFNPGFSLDEQKIFLVKDPELWKALGFEEGYAGAATVLRQRLFGGPVVDEKPVLFVWAFRPRAPEDFVRIVLHEAVHLKDRGALELHENAYAALRLAEGYTELRSRELTNQSLGLLNLPASYPKVYQAEVETVRRLIESIGEAPLQELVERSSIAGLRRALGARWGYIEAVCELNAGAFRFDHRAVEAIREIVSQTPSHRRGLEAVVRSFYKDRDSKVVDQALRRAGRQGRGFLWSPPEGAGRLERVKFGLRLGALNFALNLASLGMMHALAYHSHTNYVPPPLSLDASSLINLLIMVVMLAPPIEELVFCAFLYGGLRNLLSRALGHRSAALLIAGALNVAAFVLAHETADPVYMLIRALGAMLLVYAFEKGGLAASVTNHAFFNFMFMLAGVFALASGSTLVALFVPAAVCGALLGLAWLHDWLSFH